MLCGFRIQRFSTGISRAGIALLMLAAPLSLAQQAQKPRPAEQKPEARPADDQPKEMAVKAKPPRFADAQVKVFALKHAAAHEVAKTLDNIVGGIMEVRVVPDARTNSLLVAADPENALPRVAALIDVLDQPVKSEDREEAGGSVRNVKLSRGNARIIVAQISDLLFRNRPVGVNVVADNAANTVWVSGPTASVTRVVDVITEMDQSVATPPAATGRELRFYALKEAIAPQLANTLQRTAELLALDAEVIPDSASGTLIALATPEAHTRLQQIINTLDVPAKRMGGSGGQPAKADAQPEPPKK